MSSLELDVKTAKFCRTTSGGRRFLKKVATAYSQSESISTHYPARSHSIKIYDLQRHATLPRSCPTTTTEEMMEGKA